VYELQKIPILMILPFEQKNFKLFKKKETYKLHSKCNRQEIKNPNENRGIFSDKNNNLKAIISTTITSNENFFVVIYRFKMKITIKKVYYINNNFM